MERISQISSSPQKSENSEKYLSFRPRKIEILFSNLEDQKIEFSMINRTKNRLFYKVCLFMPNFLKR